MAQGVVVITEQRDGEFRKVTYEAVSEGRRVADAMNTDVTSVVIGSGVAAIGHEMLRLYAGCAQEALVFRVVVLIEDEMRIGLQR